MNKILTKFFLSREHCYDIQFVLEKLGQTSGAFFWDYSGIGILGIDGICVLLGAIPFSE